MVGHFRRTTTTTSWTGAAGMVEAAAALDDGGGGDDGMAAAGGVASPSVSPARTRSRRFRTGASKDRCSSGSSCLGCASG